MPGDLEAALRLELKAEQTNAPEQMSYRFLKEDFTFCCVPLAPSTYIPLASVQAPLEPEGSLAATDSVEVPTTPTSPMTSSSVIPSQQL